MQLSHLIAAAGGTPQSLEVTADVALGPAAAGFQDAAEKAKAGCPVSKALTGVDITLDASLG